MRKFNFGGAVLTITALAVLISGMVELIKSRGFSSEVGQTRIDLSHVDGYSFDGVYMTNALILGITTCIDTVGRGHEYLTEGYAIDLNTVHLLHSESFPNRPFGYRPQKGNCEGKFNP